MQTSNSSGQEPGSDFIRLTVRAENPASRIQVAGPQGEPLLRIPATGQVRLSLKRGHIYLISHWVGSGEQHIREWYAEGDDPAHVQLPDDTTFITAQPLNADGQDAEAQDSRLLSCHG